MYMYVLHVCVMSMQEYDKQQAKLDKQGKKTAQAQPGAQAKLDLVRTTFQIISSKVESLFSSHM